jgi:hypothetical protein
MTEILTMSDVAHRLLTEMLRNSMVSSPVINFSQPAGVPIGHGLVLGSALQDYLEAFVVPGSEVAQGSILEARGIRFFLRSSVAARHEGLDPGRTYGWQL